MFSNIDPKLDLVLIENKWNSIKNHTNLQLAQFYEAVEFCLNNTYFQFDHGFYRQKFDTPMGSPISSFVD